MTKSYALFFSGVEETGGADMEKALVKEILVSMDEAN